MTRVLVTGGAGFIGNAVVRELLAKSYDTAVIDDLSFGTRAMALVPDARFHEIDIRNAADVDLVIGNFEPQWVIHLAAIHFIPYCDQHPFAAAEINVQGTINVLEALKKCPAVERIVFASTAAVYPVVDAPIVEDVRPHPLDIYGMTKLAGEYVVREFQAATQKTAFVCRLFNAFGPHETNAHLIPEIHRQLRDGARSVALGNLDPRRDFVHTSDVARAIRLLLESSMVGYNVFNVGSGSAYSVREIVHAFERAAGHTISIEQDPKRTRKSDRPNLVANISKLTSATGWTPDVTLDAGLAALLNPAT